MSTRERILDAAAEIMRTRGVASTTTKEIARAAGCSEALLYKHFRDKEELLTYVLKERMPAFNGIRHPGEATVEENLVAITHGALRFYTRSFPMMASMAAQPKLMAATRDSMRKYQAGPHVAVDWLATYLAGEQQIGRVSPDADIPVMAALLMGACFQQGFLHYVREGVDGEEIPKSLAESLVHGLLPVLAPAG
ncbi:TetR/AcrR family transcriptional regulator [Actinomadura rudentiformis]|uniref:TetR/AcrR family transcriptional regulator n=1 Tax=Actinomadura rudentiformis TaxID=359158 RepID=A0A6H9YCE7_9ACTN|nr:TetR/AcrR family transcriptional regulator [Actinomadura rudentiformis]KAB2343066.1 TetR/AcrR family transcriptional regulator [Actinomadura rudentiformis]